MKIETLNRLKTMFTISFYPLTTIEQNLNNKILIESCLSKEIYKKISIFIILVFFIQSDLFAINKIVLKIENQIITKIDISRDAIPHCFKSKFSKPRSK